MYEKSPENHGNLANAALYVLSNELVASVTTEHDFSTQVIPKLLKRIYVVETHKTYIDIGTPESYQRAQEIANVY
jgi:mannose-1-phosphate guanylyltransferase